MRSRWSRAEAWAVFGFALFFFVLPNLQQRVSGAAQTSAAPAGTAQLLLGLAVLPALTLVLVWCMASRARGAREVLDTVFGSVRPRSSAAKAGAADLLRAVGLGVAVGLASIPLTGVLMKATELVLVRLGAEAGVQNAMQMFLDPAAPPLHRVAISLHAILLAPLCEEILFRSVILTSLLRKAPPGSSGLVSSPWRAIWISAVFFAGVHMFLAGLPSLTVLGVLFAVLFLRTGTLWSSVAMHVVFNACNLLMALAR